MIWFLFKMNLKNTDCKPDRFNCNVILSKERLHSYLQVLGKGQRIKVLIVLGYRSSVYFWSQCVFHCFSSLFDLFPISLNHSLYIHKYEHSPSVLCSEWQMDQLVYCHLSNCIMLSCIITYRDISDLVDDRFLCMFSACIKHICLDCTILCIIYIY